MGGVRNSQVDKETSRKKPLEQAGSDSQLNVSTVVDTLRKLTKKKAQNYGDPRYGYFLFLLGTLGNNNHGKNL